MQYRQRLKSWISECVWVNPYWSKLSEHPGRIFLEQDLLADKQTFKLAIAGFKAIICEFGSGSGEHLIELARRNPDTAVIGFELRFKRIVRTIEKAKRAGLDNAFVICGYAQNVKAILDSESVSAVYINFPDPWEKNVKHRLINQAFLEELGSLAIRGASVNFKTDHKEYFLAAKELIESSEFFDLCFCSEDLYRDLPVEEIIPTEFEKLFLSQDLKICALRCEVV